MHHVLLRTMCGAEQSPCRRTCGVADIWDVGLRAIELVFVVVEVVLRANLCRALVLVLCLKTGLWSTAQQVHVS